MPKQSLWQNIKHLVVCDNKLNSIKETITQSKEKLSREHKLVENLQVSLEKKERQCLEEKKNVRFVELQADELNNKEKEKKKKLEQTSRPKEYKALEKELSLLIQQIIKQEDVLMDAWSKLDTATKKHAEEKKAYNQQKISLKEKITEQEFEIKALEEKQVQLEEQRPEHVKLIPDEWIKLYNRMKNKVEDPIVPVIQKSCGSCFYAILPQDLSKLKKDGMLLCRSCYRFLYYDYDKEKEEEASKHE